jgi:hypothetical protein
MSYALSKSGLSRHSQSRLWLGHGLPLFTGRRCPAFFINLRGSPEGHRVQSTNIHPFSPMEDGLE